MFRCAAALFLILHTASAQAPRPVVILDGARDEAVSHEGTLGAVAVEQRWLLRIAAGASRFYGITVEDLAGTSPKKLHAEVFLEGTKPIRFQWRIEDVEGRKNNDSAAWIEVELKPGLQRLEVPLAGLKSRKGERVLDFSNGVSRLRLSRRADGDAAAFAMGTLAFSGEGAAKPDPERLKQALETRARRREEVSSALATFPAPRRVTTALELLADATTPEDVRRAARITLQRTSEGAALDALVQRAGKDVPEREELLFVLAGNATPEAAKAVLRFMKDPKLSLTQRVALLRGATRCGRIHIEALKLAPEGSAWPLRTALLEHASLSNCDAGVDAILTCAGMSEAPRVRSAAQQFLIQRLGTDLGNDVAAWKELWLARKNAAPADGKASPSPYGSFYGIGADGGSLVFVLDGSGSMREVVKGGRAAEHIKSSAHLRSLELSTRLDLLKAELLHVLSKLPEGTRVGIVFFNDEALWLTDGLERLDPLTREKMGNRVRSQSAGQKTNIHAGVQLAFHPEKKPAPKDALDGPDTIFLLSDGAPSAGAILNENELCDAFLRWNIGRAIRIHTVNVGDRATPWMKRVSEGTGGVHQDLSSERSAERNTK